MAHKSELEALLEQKEDEIRFLEGRALAYSARISVLQTRLVTTLDTLDAVQSAHAQEIGALSHEMGHLRDKLRHYTEVVKSAELERDDMRDAVLKLVEKVESSNDYNDWPHSRIYISSLTDHFPESLFKQPRTSDEDELLLYAASMIDGLRRERDRERKAHAHSRAHAEARVLSLEAQLSRREAELETCAVHAGHPGPPPVPVIERTKPRDDPISSEQIISVLDATLARNMVLEVEIKSLFKRLENAKAIPPLNPSDIQPTVLLSPAKRGNGSEPKVDLAIAFEEHLPSQPIEHDNISQPKISESSLDGDHHIIEDLDHQIRDLGDKIDAFRDERNVLFQKISRMVPVQEKQHEDSDQTSNLEHRLLAVENECNQLRQSEHTLREELKATRASSVAREAELVKEISSLKNAVDDDQDETIHVPNLLDSSDGEVSMELATPLLPISVISVQSTHSPPGVAYDAGSPLMGVMPLPSSPWSGSGVMSPATPDVPDIVYNGQLSQTIQSPHLVAELRRVAPVMDGTQRQLAAGETALDSLADIITELNL